MKSVRFAIVSALLIFSAPALAAGAIAVDDEHGTAARDVGYGVGWGDTREAAGRDAMRVCKSEGNTNCKVMVRFDTCGAYAGSRTTYGVGWGKTEEAAKRMALENCPNCRIVVSDCE